MTTETKQTQSRNSETPPLPLSAYRAVVEARAAADAALASANRAVASLRRAVRS